MINASDILRIAAETDDLHKIQLLWHLHSYVVEKGGSDRFNRELQEWFPEICRAVRLPENILQIGIEYLQGYGVNYSLQKHVRDLIYGHMERSAKVAREKFYLTNIGRDVWETLDWCLEEQRPCLLEGLQGRGKSEAAKWWWEAHRGQARYATLDGFATQREFFSALSKPYGVPHLHANAPTQIQYRIQDVIVRSGLMQIIDEAHFALPERTQAGRPAIIDWINCGLCNHNVPVALVTTPQFGPRLSAFENRTTYNADQFKRRFSGRWRKLDENTSEDDLTALTKKVLPGVGNAGVELAVNYAGAFGRDVSALFDLVKDAQRRARLAGRTQPTFRDLQEAYKLDRLPSENAMADAFTPKPPKQKPAKLSAAAAERPAIRSAGARELQPPIAGGRVDTLKPQILEPAE